MSSDTVVLPPLLHFREILVILQLPSRGKAVPNTYLSFESFESL